MGQENQARMSAYVCLFKHLVPGIGTEGQIGTGEALLDPLERRKKNGNNRRVIGTTWCLVNRCKKIAKTAGQTDMTHNLCADDYYRGQNPFG